MRRVLKYVRCFPGVSCQMELHAIGTTGSHQRIQPNQAMAIAVLTPSGADEQATIATALSDMDAGLAALEAPRDKIRALKQAMMQELHTGRTRLV